MGGLESYEPNDVYIISARHQKVEFNAAMYLMVDPRTGSFFILTEKVVTERDPLTLQKKILLDPMWRIIATRAPVRANNLLTCCFQNSFAIVQKCKLCHCSEM